jgi:hypothetical protein
MVGNVETLTIINKSINETEEKLPNETVVLAIQAGRAERRQIAGL